MIVNKIDLYAYFELERKDGNNGYLTAYAYSLSHEINPMRMYPAILIIPGGGYGYVSAREGEPVAAEFLARNFSAFVLDYSVAPHSYPAQLLEAAMAMVYIRENAQQYNVETHKVAVVGFSAGGHLAACLATIFDDDNIVDALGTARAALVRPQAAILSYPVISSNENIWHKRSIDNVTAGKKELQTYLSLEKRVSAKTCPTFLWHTVEDDSVPVENSLLYAMNCRSFNVPFELHVFNSGRHGLSVCNIKSDKISKPEGAREYCGAWINLAENFLKLHGLYLEI